MVKIGYFSDWHTGYNPNIDILRELLSKNVDLILSGGDWDVVPYSIEEMKKMKSEVPIYTVYGNHDDPDILRAYGILLEDGEIVNVNGLNICGVGGAIIWDNFSYPETWRTPDYYIEKTLEIKRELSRRLIKCDILLLHEPPHRLVKRIIEENTTKMDILDSKSYRLVVDVMIELIRPKLVLTGHTHANPITILNYKISGIYDTNLEIPVVNVITTINNTYTVIDTDEGKIDIYSDLGNTSVDLYTDFFTINAE